MRQQLYVNVGAIIGLQPEPTRPITKPWHASHFLAFADIDYVLFRALALADSPREAMFHLQQLTEKYLKAILLASGLSFKNHGHDLDYLVGEAATAHPVLGDPSMILFCHRLEPYQQWGHYPEMILDQDYLAANWNRYERYGLSEADLVAATLREVAARTLEGAPYKINGGSRPWLLEALAHREIPYHAERGLAADAQAYLRRMLIADNLFFTPEHLPTFGQSLHEKKRYPLVPLPREHPTGRTRYGLPFQ